MRSVRSTLPLSSLGLNLVKTVTFGILPQGVLDQDCDRQVSMPSKPVEPFRILRPALERRQRALGVFCVGPGPGGPVFLVWRGHRGREAGCVRWSAARKDSGN